jgi:asparagine synthase (glutamine-hydrolysing)
MCGIVAIVGPERAGPELEQMVECLHHRGPDARGVHRAAGGVALGHTRLAIVDLSPAGVQPMSTADQRLWVVFNGEIYNHVELRRELGGYPFRTSTDTEVLLAAYERWGEACLDRLLGMFAFVLWDARSGKVLAARDRFGVKPLYRAMRGDGAMVLASEIKAIFAAGIAARPDPVAWASYLANGLTDHSERTFWTGVEAVSPGTLLSWRPGEPVSVRRWYDLADRTGANYDTRPESVVRDEYAALLDETIRLRFRADVPVGINLSGGLDSSVLLGLVHRAYGADSDVKVFTFVTGDPAYDELPWVQQMLERTRHPLATCKLTPAEVPELAARMLAIQDEPYGGLPTLAYAKVFERARAEGVLVLLDGQGIDEQWAGYDYYRNAVGEHPTRDAPVVQGSRDAPVRPDLLLPAFRAEAGEPKPPLRFSDALRNLQYRDTVYTKIPRALRFNDRVSMASSTELREPFLDHRMFELALRQPPERKLDASRGKLLVRRIAETLLPEGVRTAPKRALQTPQREWLRGPLRGWADGRIAAAVDAFPEWLDGGAVRSAWQAYLEAGDNSFWVWQMITLGMLSTRAAHG